MNSTKRYKTRIEELVVKEKSISCGRLSSITYQQYHAKRYQESLRICLHYVPSHSACVLDIGRSTFTSKLNSYYNSVYSLGFDLQSDNGGHREVSPITNLHHIIFDLNQADKEDTWPNYPNKFDLIVFAETIEHMFIAPEYSLIMFSYLLKPNGYIIVTTPNAVSLGNRIKMFCGYNPFERIRFYAQNPGHYREYTKNELKEIGENAGLSIKACYSTNFYFCKGRTKFIAPLYIIPQFRDSLVVIYKKEE